MLYALGGQPALVGRSQHCNWPAAVAAVPSVGSGLQPDLEAVLALQPSLVVATELQATAVEPIRARGTRVVLLPHGRVADIGPAMVALSQSIGLPERGATWSQWLRQLTSRRPEPSIRALLVVARDPFYAAGPDGFGGELLGLAGARDVLTGGDWVRLDEEALLATAPDLLIESRGTVPDLAFWAARPSIPAVAAGRVCGVDEDPISRPGPRVAVALAQLRACVEGPR
jgi:iron complex transport system substrate-binding protein